MAKTAFQCFLDHQGRLIDRWRPYFDIYDRYFRQYVGSDVRVLEIGVCHGGSLQMWKAYFGPHAQIVGVDIDPRCKAYEEDQIFVEIADQSKLPKLGQFDIVIDDGSHKVSDQQASFHSIWPKTNSVYLIEDIAGTPEQNLLVQSIFNLHDDRLSHLGIYPGILVMERGENLPPKRVVIGEPSRPLNLNEKIAYGRL